MNQETIGHCWHCGLGLTKLDYGRETLCSGCHKPTRCCRNCQHHAPGRPNACAEPMAELVADKHAANFCECFEPRAQGGQSAKTDSEMLRQAAEDLFKAS